MTADPVDAPRRRLYRNPPVVEALARLHWDSAAEWKLTTPGLLYERLREVYPEEPQPRNVMQADFTQRAGDSNFEVRSGPPQMVFSAEEASRLLIVGPNDLSAHGLPPYEGWESLEDRLFSGYDLIHEVLRLHDSFTELGLRYINRIEIAAPSIRLDEYLTVTMALPPGFPDQMISFLDRVEVTYPDAPIRLGFTWASTDAPADSTAFMLDLDLVAQPEEALSAEDAKSFLRDMKERETIAFEGLLQDTLREQFGEIG